VGLHTTNVPTPPTTTTTTTTHYTTTTTANWPAPNWPGHMHGSLLELFGQTSNFSDSG
jgi:hypothetical protein